MSEQTIQDENNVSTEQNPMVNRIALETKRRNPNTVRIHIVSHALLQLIDLDQ